MTKSIVFITGANQGIGLGFVKYYLKRSWIVYAACRRPRDACKLISLVGEYESLKLLELDVTNEERISALTDEFETIGLDLIINNAGVSNEQAFGEWTQLGFQEHMRVNLIGPALITQALSKSINTGAKIINISSGMGSNVLNINPLNGLDAYAVSKASLNMLTRRLACKMMSDNVTVVAINPGWVKTRTGGTDAPAEIEEAVYKMADSISKLTIAETGTFVNEFGEVIQW